VAADSDSYEAQEALADLSLQGGDVLVAIIGYRRLVELQPNNGMAHFKLGKALATQGRNFEARESFDRAIELGVPDAIAARDALPK